MDYKSKVKLTFLIDKTFNTYIENIYNIHINRVKHAKNICKTHMCLYVYIFGNICKQHTNHFEIIICKTHIENMQIICIIYKTHIKHKQNIL